MRRCYDSGMGKKIFLIRHGQDFDNAAERVNGRRDTPLTALGIQQARETAERLREEESIALIYSSPLHRARETAGIIAETLGIGTVCIDEDLIERDYGVLTGVSRVEERAYAAAHQDKVIITDRGNPVVIEAEG